MQKQIAHAQNSSNLDPSTDDYQHHDVDALIAVGAKVSRLASLLLRIKNADQSRWTHEAILLLAKPLTKKYKLSRSVSERIAHAALIEWIRPHCRHCNGASEIRQDNGVTIQCHSCGGIGVHRYGDRERERLCGIKFVGNVAAAHNLILSNISYHVGSGLSRVNSVSMPHAI